MQKQGPKTRKRLKLEPAYSDATNKKGLALTEYRSGCPEVFLEKKCSEKMQQI